MRRTLGFLLCLFSASLLGCFSTTGEQTDVVDAGPPLGDPDRTLEYWGKLQSVMGQKMTANDLRSLANQVNQQVEVIRGASTEGVDPDLVAAAEAVATCQEKVIEMVELSGYQMAGLRATPVAAKAFVDANQAASSATARLKSLKAKLTARYGVAFPAID